MANKSDYKVDLLNSLTIKNATAEHTYTLKERQLINHIFPLIGERDITTITHQGSYFSQ